MLVHQNSEPMNPRRVVVLGARGFVGTALMGELARTGIPALGLGSADLDLTADRADEALAALLEPDDAVVMLAAITPDRTRKIPALMANLRMAETVCAAFERRPPAHMIYFSSAGVYHGGTKITEETPAEPSDLFGMMHLTREMMFKSVCPAPLAVLRSSLAHGALMSRQQKAHATAFGANQMRRIARDDGVIRLAGNGEDRRDHVWVRDIAAVTRLVLQRRSAGLLNIATGRSVSQLELAQMIASHFDPLARVELVHREHPVIHLDFDNAALTRAFPDFRFTPLEVSLAKAHESMLKLAG